MTFSNALRPWSLVLGGVLLVAVAGCQQSPAPATGQFKPVDADDERPAPKAAPETADDDASSDNVAAHAKDDAGPAGTSTRTVKPSPSSAREASNNAKAGKDLALAGPAGAKVKRLRELMKVKQPTNQRELQAIVVRLEESLQIAEEIVTDPQAGEPAQIEALEAQVGIYAFFLSSGQQEAEEGLLRAATGLSKVSDPDRSLMGKAQLLAIGIDKLINAQPKDAKKSVVAIQGFLKDAGDSPRSLPMIRTLANRLEEAGYADEAADVRDALGDHFAEHKDEEVRAVAASFKLNAALSRYTNSEGEDEDLRKQVLERTQQFVDITSASGDALEMLRENGLMRIEPIGPPEFAGEYYDLVEKAFEGHADADVVEKATSTLEKARTRLGLIGQPFALEGVQVDGKPFDWKDYEGKVVLIDFWATWCPPCLAEIPNIKKNYEKFHEKGFDVVGVNLDDEMETVERFFEVNPEIPWATVVGADENERGFSHPAAVKNAVEVIPFVVLVGRDGKVVGTHVRGLRLEKALNEMLAKTDAPVEEEGTKGAN